MSASGDHELDRFGRASNGIEAIAVFVWIQVSLWGLLGDGRQLLGALGLAAALAYCGITGPRLHGDSLADLGLPRPHENAARLLRLLRAPWRERAAAGAATAILACCAWLGWPNLLARLGLRRATPELYEWAVTGLPGHGLPLVAALPLFAGLAVFIVRRDNLRCALRSLAPIAVVLASAIAVAAIATSRDAAGTDVPRGIRELRSWRASPLFYLLWALLQQVLALGYFNARLRRAIPPGRGSRVSVAALCGLGFGSLHLPAIELCVATAICESWLAWHWQRAESRNLFAMALAHAGLASLYAEWLSLPMRVGP